MGSSNSASSKPSFLTVIKNFVGLGKKKAEIANEIAAVLDNNTVQADTVKSSGDDVAELFSQTKIDKAMSELPEEEDETITAAIDAIKKSGAKPFIIFRNNELYIKIMPNLLAHLQKHDISYDLKVFPK